MRDTVTEIVTYVIILVDFHEFHVLSAVSPFHLSFENVRVCKLLCDYNSVKQKLLFIV